MTYRTPLAAAFLATLLANVGHAQEQDEPIFRLLARDGDEISDGSGRTVTPFASRDVIGLDRSGRALFDASLRDAGGTVLTSGVFVTDGSTVRLVFVVGGTPPTAGIDVGGGTIQSLDDDVRFSPSGEVLANVFLLGGAVQGEALMTDRDGTQRVEAVTGTPFNGVCGLHDIGNGTTAGQYAYSEGHLILHFINSSGLCGNNLRGVYRAFDGGNPTLVAIQDGTVPGTAEEFDLLFTGPALNEEGDYLFTGRYTPPGGELTSVLLLSQPDAPLSVIATRPSGSFGSSFAAWKVGETANGQTTPRTAYALTLPGGVHEVYDSAHGATPILATGQTVGNYTFQNLHGGIAIGGNDAAIVVGDTTGGGIPANGEAVWRMSTAQTPPMQVVLHENGPVPGDDPRALNETITRIFTVNMNEDGRLAVECELSGTQAILIEEKGALGRGKFRVAVVRRDTLPTGSGPGEAFGLLGQLPAFPRVVGPGDGLNQTRFNRAGQFVFRAAMDPDDGSPNFTGVYTVSLDPPPEVCDVTVKRKGRNVSVAGAGKGDCTLTIRSDTLGEFVFIPGENTTVNEQSSSFPVQGATGSIKIKLGGGNDTLTFESSNGACDQDSLEDVFRNVSIDTGDGLDRITLKDLEIRGSLTIRTGSGGKDSIFVNDTCIERNVKIVGGAQESSIRFESCHLDGRTNIRMPGGPAQDSPPSELTFQSCFLFHTTIKGSRAADDIDFRGCIFDGNLKIDSGGGILEQVLINDTMFDPGTISVRATKSDTLILRMTDVETETGGLKVNTGFGGCDVSLTRCHILRDVKFKTGDSRGDARQNKIHITNSFFDSALVVKGKGSHDIFVGGGSKVFDGIAINTKGGILDLVGVSETDIEGKGHLQVSSKATAFEGRFHRNTIFDGNLFVRGTKGPDKVYVSQTDLVGNIKISLFDGDDLVDIQSTTVEDLRLFGGSGNDLLDNGGRSENGVTGDLVEDSFEGAAPPP